MAIAIKAEQVSKAYQLGEFSTGTLSRDVERLWYRVRGKEDPFLKIGETNDRTVKGESNVVWSLKDINFEIQQGDAVGIIGRNGAGKSTLLKILSRITSPTTGSIKVKGRIASLLEVGTGFHPELTGRENIFLNGAIMGMRKAEIKNKFDEIVAFSGVERYIDTPVKRYSSGMYVRLAFAVAAHLESEILIVDEVLAVGDAEFQKKCLGKMQDVSSNEGRTVLFVSHNMGVITQLCQKAILLKSGVLGIAGNARSVVDQYINSQNGEENAYEADPKIADKKQNYFTKIYSSNSKGEKASEFTFEESVIVNFQFIVNNKNPNLQIGIGLSDKYQNRITTFLQPLEFFKADGNLYNARIKLPSGIIAPNQYSFVFALWTKSGEISDLVENVCAVKIFDNGTDFAGYEGIDYGSVILKAGWENV